MRLNLSKKSRIIFKASKGRTTLLVLAALLLQLPVWAYAQSVSLTTSNASIRKVFSAIKGQTGYSFVYTGSLLKEAKPVTIHVKNVPLKQALSVVFLQQPFAYTIVDHTIILRPEKRTATKLPHENKAMIIKGKVTDQEGNPLVGATIQNKRTKEGTATDQNGQYSLRASPGDTLQISYIGYNDKRVVVSHESTLNITLLKSSSQLTEMVVVGYGEVKKKDLTGAISTISGETLNQMHTSTFDVALAGHAPGVYVTKTSGAPGADASIRIRGATSVLGVNEPLYVIDGIPVQIGGGLGADQLSDQRYYNLSPLSWLNPQDIASIDILKDASAAAIYGSRASNGVVIITTKSGKAGQAPTLRFNYAATFDRFTNKYDMLNTDQFVQVAKTAYKNAEEPFPDDFLIYQNTNTDWQDLVTRTSASNTWNIGLDGGSVKGTLYSFSASIADQLGVIKSSNFKRYNLRARVETPVTDRLKTGINVNYGQSLSKGKGSTFYYQIASYRPDVPVYDSLGNYATTPDSVQSNPVAKSTYPDETKQRNIAASIFAELEIIPGLKFRSTYSYHRTEGDYLRYTPSYDVFEMRNNRKGSRDDRSNNQSSRIFDNTLTLIKNYGKSYVNAVAGASFEQDKSEQLYISSTNFPDDKVLNNLGSAAEISRYTSSGSISGLESYFLRANYNYAGKYYVTFTGRADKSTKFGPENRWGLFPSGALAWRISEEDFMRDIPGINDLKIRLSGGKTGSANFGDFLYSTFFTTGSFYNGVNGVIPNSVPNPDIRWETTTQYNAGIDIGLWRNRIRASLDYYRKYTSGLIFYSNIPSETGGSDMLVNSGDILNHGIELQIDAEVMHQKDFRWSVNFNVSKYKGVIKKLDYGDMYGLEEGNTLGTMTGYRVEGIFQSQTEINALNDKAPNGYYQSPGTEPGDFRFKDVNGDGQVTSEDIVTIGKAEPDFYGGWLNNLRYKNFQFNVFFTYSVGNYLYDNGRKSVMLFDNANKNYATGILNAWRPDHTHTDLPRVVLNDPNNNGRDSDFFIENASFFRLKNLQISYRLNTPSLQRMFIKDIMLYVSATNVFIFTPYEGLDPEVNTSPGTLSQGYDSNIYPQTRTFTIGFNVEF